MSKELQSYVLEYKEYIGLGIVITGIIFMTLYFTIKKVEHLTEGSARPAGRIVGLRDATRDELAFRQETDPIGPTNQEPESQPQPEPQPLPEPEPLPEPQPEPEPQSEPQSDPQIDSDIIAGTEGAQEDPTLPGVPTSGSEDPKNSENLDDEDVDENGDIDKNEEMDKEEQEYEKEQKDETTGNQQIILDTSSTSTIAAVTAMGSSSLLTIGMLGCCFMLFVVIMIVALIK